MTPLTQLTVIIVLGSPNSNSGELSEIAQSRLRVAYDAFQKQSNCGILCTGGWGDHFNTSTEPHASYAKEYLKRKGIAEDRFLEFALSANTVEDALKSKEILNPLEVGRVIVITSDYHVERVEIIFKEILSDYCLEFIGVTTDLPEERSKQLKDHERQAVQTLKANGLHY